VTVIKTADDLLKVIETEREGQGIPLSWLALRSGRAHGTYWSWARKGIMPKLDTVLRYAEELGLQVTVTPK
jgi:hypothetical protein